MLPLLAIISLILAFSVDGVSARRHTRALLQDDAGSAGSGTRDLLQDYAGDYGENFETKCSSDDDCTGGLTCILEVEGYCGYDRGVSCSASAPKAQCGGYLQCIGDVCTDNFGDTCNGSSVCTGSLVCDNKKCTGSSPVYTPVATPSPSPRPSPVYIPSPSPLPVYVPSPSPVSFPSPIPRPSPSPVTVTPSSSYYNTTGGAYGSSSDSGGDSGGLSTGAIVGISVGAVVVAAAVVLGTAYGIKHVRGDRVVKVTEVAS